MWHVKIVFENVTCFLTQNEEQCLSKKFAGKFDEKTAKQLKKKYKKNHAQLVHDLYVEGQRWI